MSCNNNIVNLKYLCYLPLYGDDGELKMYDEFYLIPDLKHQLLGSFYWLQKIKLPFPRFSPVFITEKHKKTSGIFNRI